MGRKKRRQLTKEERRARLDRAHEQLQTAVESLTTSQGWQNMIAARSWLRRYSMNNLLMISIQRPDATDVRSLKKWNDVGRHVRKGEKAIKILAPCRYRVTDDNEDDDTRYEVRGFTLVSVFDVSQTDGQPLPDDTSVVPDELRGLAPDELWNHVAALITERGYSIERGDCGTAYGWVRFDTRTVRVRANVEPAQATKTLVHELAHIWSGHDSRPGLTRAQHEVEAESVACLVSTVMGLDTLPYSVPYVAHWAGDADTARASADRVATVADQITAALQERASTHNTTAD